MIDRPIRKNKDGRTILEEFDGYTDTYNLQNYFSDTLALEEDFSDMQMLICDILGKLPDMPLTNIDISWITILEQACITILEKINTKLQ